MEPTKDGMCFTVAEAEIIGVPRDVAEANARLIAAAPDLLAALKEIQRCWAKFGDPKSGTRAEAELGASILIARFAIAKAEGKDA